MGRVVRAIAALLCVLAFKPARAHAGSLTFSGASIVTTFNLDAGSTTIPITYTVQDASAASAVATGHGTCIIGAYSPCPPPVIVPPDSGSPEIDGTIFFGIISEASRQRSSSAPEPGAAALLILAACAVIARSSAR